MIVTRKNWGSFDVERRKTSLDNALRALKKIPTKKLNKGQRRALTCLKSQLHNIQSDVKSFGRGGMSTSSLKNLANFLKKYRH
jgi:flagellar biosynthesis chaperone FliJ